MSATQEKLLLSIPEVAARLGISVPTAKKRIASGAIRSVKDGGLRRVRPDDLKAYVDALPSSGPDPAT